jgi:hypothetical protein
MTWKKFYRKEVLETLQSGPKTTHELIAISFGYWDSLEHFRCECKGIKMLEFMPSHYSRKRADERRTGSGEYRRRILPQAE